MHVSELGDLPRNPRQQTSLKRRHHQPGRDGVQGRSACGPQLDLPGGRSGRIQQIPSSQVLRVSAEGHRNMQAGHYVPRSRQRHLQVHRGKRVRMPSCSLSVNRTYCGHGTGSLFHCAPSVPHYANNKATGFMKPGHVFTIEPMINAGVQKDITWPDNWTAVTADGQRSAQF